MFWLLLVELILGIIKFLFVLKILVKIYKIWIINIYYKYLILVCILKIKLN